MRRARRLWRRQSYGCQQAIVLIGLVALLAIGAAVAAATLL